MESRQKAIISFIFLIVLIFGLYFFADWFSKATGYNIEDDPDVSLAKCLSKKGIVFYGSEGCSLCNGQKDMFGPTALEYLGYIDCSKSPGECAHLQKVPAWYINGTISYGLKTIEELKTLSKCE